MAAGSLDEAPCVPRRRVGWRTARARAGLCLVAVAVGLAGCTSSLRKAVMDNDVARTSQLVEAGVDVQEALTEALLYERLDVAEALVDQHGARIDGGDPKDRERKVVRAKGWETDDNCPLFVPVIRGRVESTRWLLERGVDPNCRDAQGRTALYMVASFMHGAEVYGPIVDLLLAHGADSRAQDARGLTPIRLATRIPQNDFDARMRGHDQRAEGQVATGSAPAPRPAAAASSTLPDIDAPVKTGARASADAGVVIGIEDYFVLPDVPFAARDAEAFYRFLVFTRGVPTERVKLLHKGASREALLAAVEEAGQMASSDGTVWVYFAGHGAASPSTGVRLLLGDDARADLLTFESRAVSVPEVRERAAAGGARVAMVLDTCYTGAGRDGAELIAGKRFAVPTYAVPDTPAVLEWTAASPGEWSGPLESARHGAFTYLVIGTLRGWADGHLSGQADGEVTAEEAQLYVRDALRSLQIDDQTPVMSGQGLSSWVLSADVSEAAPTFDATSQ